jgi:NADPH-dependent ferric siderophore reductase
LESVEQMLASVPSPALPADEVSVMARLRALLLQEKSQPKEAMKVATYWKHGASDTHELPAS